MGRQKRKLIKTNDLFARKIKQQQRQQALLSLSRLLLSNVSEENSYTPADFTNFLWKKENTALRQELTESGLIRVKRELLGQKIIPKPALLKDNRIDKKILEQFQETLREQIAPTSDAAGNDDSRLPAGDSADHLLASPSGVASSVPSQPAQAGEAEDASSSAARNDDDSHLPAGDSAHYSIASPSGVASSVPSQPAQTREAEDASSSAAGNDDSHLPAGDSAHDSIASPSGVASSVPSQPAQAGEADGANLSPTSPPDEQTPAFAQRVDGASSSKTPPKALSERVKAFLKNVQRVHVTIEMRPLADKSSQGLWFNETASDCLATFIAATSNNSNLSEENAKLILSGDGQRVTAEGFANFPFSSGQLEAGGGRLHPNLVALLACLPSGTYELAPRYQQLFEQSREAYERAAWGDQYEIRKEQVIIRTSDDPVAAQQVIAPRVPRRFQRVLRELDCCESQVRIRKQARKISETNSPLSDEDWKQLPMIVKFALDKSRSLGSCQEAWFEVVGACWEAARKNFRSVDLDQTVCEEIQQEIKSFSARYALYPGLVEVFYRKLITSGSSFFYEIVSSQIPKKVAEKLLLEFVCQSDDGAVDFLIGSVTDPGVLTEALRQAVSGHNSDLLLLLLKQMNACELPLPENCVRKLVRSRAFNEEVRNSVSQFPRRSIQMKLARELALFVASGRSSLPRERALVQCRGALRLAELKVTVVQLAGLNNIVMRASDADIEAANRVVFGHNGCFQRLLYGRGPDGGLERQTIPVVTGGVERTVSLLTVPRLEARDIRLLEFIVDQIVNQQAEDVSPEDVRLLTLAIARSSDLPPQAALRILGRLLGHSANQNLNQQQKSALIQAAIDRLNHEPKDFNKKRTDEKIFWYLPSLRIFSDIAKLPESPEPTHDEVSTLPESPERTHDEVPARSYRNVSTACEVLLKYAVLLAFSVSRLFILTSKDRVETVASVAHASANFFAQVNNSQKRQAQESAEQAKNIPMRITGEGALKDMAFKAFSSS